MPHDDVAPLPGYHPEIGLLLASMQDSTREWRENLEEPSVEAIVWQPAPNAYSIGGLLLHLIDCEDSWFYDFLAGNEREPEEVALLLSRQTIQDEGIWPTPPAQPLSWYYELHDRVRSRAFEALKGIEPSRVYQRRRPEYTATARWVVAHVLEHDSYTGGQAVALYELFKKRPLS
jgi:uncharacterized damage-inducible protein DinB